MQNALWPRLIVEFIGPFALMFMGGAIIASKGENLVATALAHGLASRLS